MAPRKPKTPKSLTEALHDLLPRLEDDLRARSDAEPALRSALEEEHRAAIKAHRTGETFNAWRDEVVTQIAVAWVLACVFVRFLEDNELIETHRISGPVTPQDRRKRAIEEQEAYFQRHPTENERDYLEATFRELSKLPSLGALLGPANTNLWRFGPSAEGAKLLFEFFRRLDDVGSEPRLRFPFTDPSLSTRFLGDLYQDLSEDAKKRYALLQTPIFVEEFILDRTLEPALAEFGLPGLRMIDPTVGSGHFLLGGFERLLERWQKAEPGTDVRVLVQRVLDSLFGVDLNPFAVEICRFRLLVAALKASDVKRLADAPSFCTNIVVGDSLLHGPRFNDPGRAQGRFEFPDVATHNYRHEDKAELARVLGHHYHVVVGNPPYITVKDKALNEVYRERYGSCKGKYALSVPFLERFVELALLKEGARAAGFVGQITANSFMKREFGSKLIEEFVPNWDLTHVLDTSGAYIPGHGTPTVILFLRNQPPITTTVRAVLSICGEPSTPENAAQGKVWCALVAQVDRPGSQSEYFSVEDKARDGFTKHPWSIGGGGAADLKEALDELGACSLGERVDTIGFASFTGQDDAFVASRRAFDRHRVEKQFIFDFVTGDTVRDWSSLSPDAALVTIDTNFEPIRLDESTSWYRFLWPCRKALASTKSFAATREQLGEPWWMWYRWIPEKYRVRMSITYAEIATHNHFVLDRGGKVFKQTAPVIKLPLGATEDDHLALLGLLNSSTACFWLKQVTHQKQMTGGDGVRIESKAKVPHAFNASALRELPVPESLGEPATRSRLVAITKEMEDSVEGLRRTTAESLVAQRPQTAREMLSWWEDMLAKRRVIRARMVRLQEDIDFLVYRMYGLLEDDLVDDTVPTPPDLDAGMRGFEILAQHSDEGFVVPSTVPAHWPPAVRNLWTARMAAIQSSAELRLVEHANYKRRWVGVQGLFNHKARRDELRDAVRAAICSKAEECLRLRASVPFAMTVARLAEELGGDREFQVLAEVVANGATPDYVDVLSEAIESEHVPFLAALRYSGSGLRIRGDWEHTWELQRKEDVIDALVALPKGHPKKIDETEAGLRKHREIGDIPVPRKYTSADFQQSAYWSKRGKLDVPKERFISYPNTSPDGDGTLLLGWAGWDHKQQAAALGAHYMKMRDAGWEPERLRPLLAGIAELVPWLRQWHGNDPDMGDLGGFYNQFLENECARLGLQKHELSEWRPPEKKRGRGGKKKAKAESEEALVEEDAG